MGKIAGQVSVKMTEETAKAIIDWISDIYLPNRKDVQPLLAVEYSRELPGLLIGLCRQLETILRRKALKRSLFVRPLKRKSVAALLDATRYRSSPTFFGSGGSVESYSPGPLRQGLEWMAQALRPSHRPSLSIGEIRSRAEGKVHVDERHRRDMVVRLREIDEAVSSYRANGPLLGRTRGK